MKENSILTEVNNKVYTPNCFEITNLQIEKESQSYDACRFDINGLKIISRSSKVTPSKAGQFVTFWKRKEKGPIEPFHEADAFDFFVVNIRTDSGLGQFVFPKAILVQKGIISTDNKEGKRAFRVYTKWDMGLNKTAERTQKWQQEFFYSVDRAEDDKSVLSHFR